MAARPNVAAQKAAAPSGAAATPNAPDAGSQAAKGSPAGKGSPSSKRSAPDRSAPDKGNLSKGNPRKGNPNVGHGPGTRKDLSRVQVEAIRQLALDLARKGAGPDTVLICNPVSEPSALPAKELLYDRCRWCETDIYYDRLMPSPPDIVRVCLKCGVLLIKAEKQGAN